MATNNPSFLDVFWIKSSIYRGCSAMVHDQRVSMFPSAQRVHHTPDGPDLPSNTPAIRGQKWNLKVGTQSHRNMRSEIGSVKMKLRRHTSTWNRWLPILRVRLSSGNSGSVGSAALSEPWQWWNSIPKPLNQNGWGENFQWIMDDNGTNGSQFLELKWY